MDHIFSLKTLIDKYVTHTSKGKLFSCFVGFKKAFDSIWHQGLLYKLLKYKIGGKLFVVISNMYSNSRCCVKDAAILGLNFLTTEKESDKAAFYHQYVLTFISTNYHIHSIAMEKTRSCF